MWDWVSIMTRSKNGKIYWTAERAMTSYELWFRKIRNIFLLFIVPINRRNLFSDIRATIARLRLEKLLTIQKFAPWWPWTLLRLCYIYNYFLTVHRLLLFRLRLEEFLTIQKCAPWWPWTPLRPRLGSNTTHIPGYLGRIPWRGRLKC